ncbi:MAG: hypothetical protein NWE89_01410 [Candidatus Bathyarchaeota archaeon]|nr:hypothetical protein [Candidatus Bathyarchaeota archaeon]
MVIGNKTYPRLKKNIKNLYSKYDFISKLWSGPKDSNLLIIQLVPTRYDYMKPGDWDSQIIELV